MPSAPRQFGSATFTVSYAASAALRATAKRALARATSTGPFEHNLAAGVEQLRWPGQPDPIADDLIAHHSALTTPGEVPSAVRVAGDSLPWDPHLYDPPQRADQWQFYDTDVTREWGDLGERPALALVFYGYGATAADAIAEARAARRSDFVAFFDGEDDCPMDFPAIRSVDIFHAAHTPEPAGDPDGGR